MWRWFRSVWSCLVCMRLDSLAGIRVGGHRLSSGREALRNRVRGLGQLLSPDNLFHLSWAFYGSQLKVSIAIVSAGTTDAFRALVQGGKPNSSPSRPARRKAPS